MPLFGKKAEKKEDTSLVSANRRRLSVGQVEESSGYLLRKLEKGIGTDISYCTGGISYCSRSTTRRKLFW